MLAEAYWLSFKDGVFDEAVSSFAMYRGCLTITTSNIFDRFFVPKIVTGPKKLDGHIPDVNLTQEMKKKKLNNSPYSKDKFEYDEVRDCFICPYGDVLTRKGEYEYNGKIQYKYYGASCGECRDISVIWEFSKIPCLGVCTYPVFQ